MLLYNALRIIQDTGWQKFTDVGSGGSDSELDIFRWNGHFLPHNLYYHVCVKIGADVQTILIKSKETGMFYNKYPRSETNATRENRKNGKRRN